MCVSFMLGLVIISGLADIICTLHYSYSICHNLPDYSIVTAKFGREEYLLCLKMVPLGTYHHLSTLTHIHLDPDLDESTKSQELSLLDVTMASGFPIEAPSTGSAEGYIGDDGHFYGMLHIGNRTLYADPYNKDDPTKGFGPFEDGSFIAPIRTRRDFAQNLITSDIKKMSLDVEEPSRSTNARICDLLVLADLEFFRRDANSSLGLVVRRMVHAITQADIIFRNADFDEDGMPDNIGFSVKFILVLTSTETNARVFGDLTQSGGSVDGKSYLMRFARLRRLSEVCLGVAFSGHSFQNRTLGLSFTALGGGLGVAAGGVCDRRAFGRSFNTLAIAHAASKDERVPERIAALTLAHEIGHSFGAHHDDNFPNPQCRGYLMGAQSSSGNSPTHFEFSLCSKRLIAATLTTMGYCLYEEARPFCGNGIVEEDEACDCGLPVRCVDRDLCCTARTGAAEHYEEGTLHKAGCAVAPTATCHPSQGPCCTRKCQYANLTEHGIDCSTLGQECSCSDLSCSCGLGGRCLSDGSCHAAECAAQGLRECPCEQTGGRLEAERMCGVCCLVPGRSRREPDICLVAELAARALDTTNQTNWLLDYSGPNLTISLCKNCEPTMIRAWPVDGWCVALGVVGLCLPSGVCQTERPRSNVYPDIMRITLSNKKQESSSAERIRTSALLLLTICIAVLLW